MTTVIVNASNRSKKQTAVRLLKNALNREQSILKTGLKRTESKLKVLEKKYSMSSVKFFKQYKNGEVDDRNDFVDWAGEFQIYKSLKEQMNVLKEIIV